MLLKKKSDYIPGQDDNDDSFRLAVEVSVKKFKKQHATYNFKEIFLRKRFDCFIYHKLLFCK